MHDRPKHSSSGSPLAACHLHGTTPVSGCPNCAQGERAHEDAQPSLTDVLREITELGATDVAELLEATDNTAELEALLADTQVVLDSPRLPTFCHDHLFGPTEPCATCLAVAKAVQS